MIITKENADKVINNLKSGGFSTQFPATQLKREISDVINTIDPRTITVFITAMLNYGYIKKVNESIFAFSD